MGTVSVLCCSCTVFLWCHHETVTRLLNITLCLISEQFHAVYNLYASVWLDHMSRCWVFISCNRLSPTTGNGFCKWLPTFLSYMLILNRKCMYVMFLKSPVRQGTINFQQERSYTGAVNVFMTSNWLLADELFRRKRKSVPSRNELHVVIALSPFPWVLYSTKLILG